MDGKTVKKKASSSKAQNGKFTYTITVSSSVKKKTVYAVAYVKYKTAAGSIVTVYSKSAESVYAG